MIEFRDISLNFTNKVVFKNYNLTVQAGEKILFNSDSGTGKTSLFRMLLGFQQPDSGEILINKDPITEKNLKLIRANFAYLSQDIELPGHNFKQILEDIYSFELNSHLQCDDVYIKELFDRLELTDDFMFKNIADISGGERQRLGLMICFLLQRPIWLLDEPTSALDSRIRKILLDFVYNSEKTILVVSHDKQWVNSDKLRIERW